MTRTAKQSILGYAWLAACILGVSIYNLLAIRDYWAQRLADRLDQRSVEKATFLQPQNARYHDLLCRNMIYISGQFKQAVKECQKASELNPYNSSYWLDLAQAYVTVGEKQPSTDALHKAIAVDPTTPDTAWNAANFLLVQGNVQDALKQFAIVLRGEPSMATPVLNISWQSLHDVTLIQGIIPPNPDVYLAFIQLLLSNGEIAPAQQVWSALFQLNVPFDYHRALFYVDSLLMARVVNGASNAWDQLSSQSKALQAYSQPDDLIKNGSFSQEILNSGFDWRYTPRAHISVALDTVEFHSAPRSLSLTYDGTGGDAGIFEYVAVQPNTSYRLSAWVMSDGLETANSPRITLSDASTNTIYATTEETNGTISWRRLETKLQTGPQTTLLVLAILRNPSETRIQGKIWFDDFSLQPM